ncbi:unnamed protein product [Sphagnum compactum]
MNNTEHHVKSNMIISAGAASKHNDQIRRLSTLKAHAATSSSGDEEEILMEIILYNFDHADYVDPIPAEVEPHRLGK